MASGATDEASQRGGRPGQEVARESWQEHQKRNRSVIVDLFTGLLKGTVVCPVKECGRVSIKFDPFTLLSIPLPVVTTKVVVFTFVPSDPAAVSTPAMGFALLLLAQATVQSYTQYGVTVQKTASIAELREGRGRAAGQCRSTQRAPRARGRDLQGRWQAAQGD
jgi:hypothetical protein